ncbi:11150_t:CDS:2 [Racocetra fulgida]|uniref:11150_t:CDS:1 n=1 Tax=Racocetra fulgida TaxID=60492 RepID=A0A9N8WJG3_9GLOM|nr:11150_t:CDS:2 [Racocetra fulgida]
MHISKKINAFMSSGYAKHLQGQWHAAHKLSLPGILGRIITENDLTNKKPFFKPTFLIFRTPSNKPVSHISLYQALNVVAIPDSYYILPFLVQQLS